MDDEIGAAAGATWRQLHEHGELTPAKLKQRTKLPEQLLLLGLGWLAREGKVRFVREAVVARLVWKSEMAHPAYPVDSTAYNWR